MVDRGTWARDILKGLGVPASEENMVAMLAWMHTEDGSSGALDRNNPLNTSMHVPGAPRIDADGVRDYPSYEVGLRATIATIRLDHYDGVRQALERGNSATGVIRAINASPWAERKYDLGIVPVARRQLAAHPGWLPKDDRDGRGEPRIRRGWQVPSGHQRVMVYPRELSNVVSTLVDQADPLASVQRTCQRIMDDLSLNAFLTPGTDLPYGMPGGGSRDRMVKVAQELEDTVEPKYGFNAVATGFGEVAHWVATFRQRLLDVDEDHGRSPRSRKQVQVMLAALRRNGASAEEVAALEAVWLGGLRRGRVPARRPSSPKPADRQPRPPRVQAFRGPRVVKINKVLDVARSQLGYREGANNHSKYGVWYGYPNGQWCAMYVSWVFAKSGNPLPHIQSGRGFAHTGIAWGVLDGKGKLERKPQKGDVFLYGGTGDNGHTGIVSEVHDDGSFSTIEGNSADRVQTMRRRSGDGHDYRFWTPIT